MERRQFVRRAVLFSAPVAVLSGCVEDEPVDDEDEDDEPPDEREVSLADTRFETVRRGGGTRGDEVSFDFDEEAQTVTVEGLLTGRNSCYTAELESADYDAVEDVFAMNVRPFEDRDEDEMCLQVITEIEYRVVAEFEDGIPGRAVVSHRGTEVAEATRPEG